MREEIERVVGLPGDDCILASAKEGIGVDEILEAIVKRIPPPRGDRAAPLRALIFDSHYDAYKGVIAYCRFIDGTVKVARACAHDVERRARRGDGGRHLPPDDDGHRLPRGRRSRLHRHRLEGRAATCASATRSRPLRGRAEGALPGYQPAKPMVFAGLYPTNGDEYPLLREALERLKLNDASLIYEPESSVALGFGFRCGFLGMLHMEIIQERLEREYNLELLITAPSVEYHVYHARRLGEERSKTRRSCRRQARSTASRSRGSTCRSSRPAATSARSWSWSARGAARFGKMDYVDEQRVLLTYQMPLGRADRRLLRPAQDAHPGLRQPGLSLRRVPSVRAGQAGRAGQRPAGGCAEHDHPPAKRPISRVATLIEKLRQLIPRQMFDVPIQAAIGGKIIARETIRAMRKNVLAKCYGGDITRKRKLLEKQAEGKKRMKRVGQVEIPQEAFMAVLSLRD